MTGVRRRSGARSSRVALVGALILAVLVTVALAAPLLAPYDPNARVGVPFAAPSAAHWLGTNDVGQDLLSILIFGARISLMVGIAAALAATVVGTGVGVVAGYARGAVDATLMRIVDVALALPTLPLAIVIGVFLGPGLATQILVVTAVVWAGAARELRAQVLSLREHAHIEAVRAMGGRGRYVLRRHVVPAVVPLVVPQFVLATKTAIVLSASLAFLGLGDVTAKSWGTMLSFAQARNAFLTDAWLWWVLPPGAMIAVTVLAFAMLGHAFEERARPVLRLAGRPTGTRPTGTRAAAPAVVPAGVGALAGTDTEPLRIEGLTVIYGDGRDRVVAADGVSLTVRAGELVGLVGESGAGKSTVASVAAGMPPPGARIESGRALLAGRDLAALSPGQLRALRGDRVGLVPQDAMNALNPVLTVGCQVAEAVTAHRRMGHDRMGRDQVARRVDELLELVGLDPSRARDHPHQLSGGMRQRVVLAIALAGEPALLVADEPTAGLDVLVQAEVLDLLDGLRRRLDLALLFVSHDMPVIESVADRIAVMRAGRLVELGSTAQITGAPRHAYTRELVEAVPRLQVPTGV